MLNKKFEKPLKRFISKINHYPQLKLWALVKRPPGLGDILTTFA